MPVVESAREVGFPCASLRSQRSRRQPARLRIKPTSRNFLFLSYAAAMEPESAPQLNGTNSSQTGLDRRNSPDANEEPPSKKTKLDEAPDNGENKGADIPPRMKGVAPIKKEFLVTFSAEPSQTTPDDDTAEASTHQEQQKLKKRPKSSGMNTHRKFGKSQDEKILCGTRMLRPEFSPDECPFGDGCRYEHDLRKYLREYKREDLKTFNGVCPVWEVRGTCPSGWRCRFVSSHMAERDTPDGRKELVLIEDEERKERTKPQFPMANSEGIVNSVSTEDKQALAKKKTKTPKADAYVNWLEQTSKQFENLQNQRKAEPEGQQSEGDGPDAAAEEPADEKEKREEQRATYVETPLLPSEKRKIYFGPETPVLAPLTTQGNLPFRRLCTDLGAQFTYSEMAMSLPLIQGHKPEWALMKAHESEMRPPTVSSRAAEIVKGYDNSKDFRFGAQIAANKPWVAVKATEVMANLTPNLRVIDLNCGCPIDLVYREGAGSALLDHPSKLEKIVRGMNTVSNEIPITVKIRTGTKDGSPTALKIAERLLLGGYEATELGLGPPGVAAITLHGRTRQQRYTKSADWGYIAECATLVKNLRQQADDVADTIREPDPRTLPNGGKIFFIGNGDCFSHEDYNDHIHHANVDSVMIARGALIKPWIFEEIQAGQYLDKSASERLALVEKFARYGLDAWGSDEHGVGTTRRFLLEWLSFAYRYVPVGILEYLPPRIQDRPPAWRGRNELETLLGSDNYKDWIKITEMFLGPAHKDFRFEPKHKSNAYEIETQG